MSERKLRLRWHSFTLMGGTLAALLVSWFIAQCFEFLPLESNPETRALKVFIWTVIAHLLMLLVWTSYVLEDILKSTEDKRFQRLASILLFVPYFPLVMLISYKFIEGIKAWHYRKLLMQDVSSYAFRPWPNQLEAVWSGPAGDSLEVLLKSNKVNNGRKVYLSELGEAIAIINEGQLNEYRFCPDDRLLQQRMLHKKASSEDSFQVLIPLPVIKGRYNALNSLVSDDIIVLDSVKSQWNDTIQGFREFIVRASYQRPPVYQNLDGYFHFLIWEQTATVSPEALYLVRFKRKNRQIFSISLNRNHRAAFSANRIRGLYVSGRNAYVLAQAGYLYFRLPPH